MSTRHEKDMSQEEIKIPVISLLNDGRVVFFNLYKFVAGFEILCSRRQDANIKTSEEFLTQELYHVEKMSANNLKKLSATLRQMSLMKIEEKPEPLFTPELYSELARKKKELKQSVAHYMKTLGKLKECQMTCWKSKAKEQKYRLMVNAAESSLKYHTEDEKEYQTRNLILKKLKSDFLAQVILHDSNTRKYVRERKREMINRDELARYAHVLRQKVMATIKLYIKSNLTLHAGDDEDLDMISECIYDLTSRTYKLDTPPLVYDINREIQQPVVQKSFYTPGNAKRVLKAAGNVGVELVNPDVADTKDCEVSTLGMCTDTMKSKVAEKKKGAFLSFKKRFINKKPRL